jgi:hypothetical protein
MSETRNQILERGLGGEEVVLKGIIVAGDHDERWTLASIVLSTDQELDLLIERDAKGDELICHLRELVIVQGFIREAQTGRKAIRITDYKILEKGTG